MHQKQKDFHVLIEQGGVIITPNNGEINLKKGEFNIVFELSEPMGVLVNGSFQETTYERAVKGKPKSDLPGFENTGMAEGLLNPDKEIFISNDAPNYWFYDDKENNRFNSVEVVNEKLICKRIIQNFYEVETKKNIKVENVSKPLYLVFISYRQGKSIVDEIETKREWVKINWIK
ncbi:MAG: hypothetical protein MUF42_03370 [Cytophagaceae bacterium]|jgi:hypothetical protein|nr:hypothetical protein [Cytophagaceae bacterium]